MELVCGGVFYNAGYPVMTADYHETDVILLRASRALQMPSLD
jgi:hypothetical protein